MISLDSWIPSDGLLLEPNALRAVKELTRCVVLTAGPGAGKTEMLAQRADFLLRTRTCRYPKRILAISFKVDASRNLKSRIRHRCGPELGSRFDSYTFHAFGKRIIDQFRPVLKGDDALEVGYRIGDHRYARTQIQFSDLVPLAIKIIKDSRIARNAIRQTYSDVFLDEFQDCTNEQYELVKLVFQGTTIRLVAVGDTKQKIMGWAGAMEGIFESFSFDFSAVKLNLYHNFRSLPRLLRMQNGIIRDLDPDSVMPKKQLSGDGGEIFALRFSNSRQEAEYLSSAIENWIRTELVPPSEIAVLVSKQLDLYTSLLTEALKAKSIPFRNERQMQDISVEPVTRLIVDYLSCLFGQQEPKAWIRLTYQLFHFLDEDSLLTHRKDFQYFFIQQRRYVALANRNDEIYSEWWSFVLKFLNRVGMENLVALSHDYESHARLKEVISQTRTHIEQLIKLDHDLPRALKTFSDDFSVRILTIHKSKGLEFDTVIILGVENQAFWADPDDERCAFFVGISRAKRRLITTNVDERERPKSHMGRWAVTRSVHQEFLNYTIPFISK